MCCCPRRIIYALLLVGQGVPQNLHAYTTAHPLEQPSQTQTIGQGPVASQEAIKMLGTNGGGFFNANSAHPFENPTPFSNFLQMLSIFIIPAGLTYTLGRMTGSPGHGWAVLAAMFVLFAAGFTTVYWAESQPHPLIHGAAQTGTAHRSGRQHGGQGGPQRHRRQLALRHHHHRRQLRRGQQHARLASLRWAAWWCSPTSCSARWSSAASARALYGMLIIVVLSVFIAGLMVGRTPEYLGKKIESYDVKMSMLYVLIFPLIILSLTAVFVLSPTIGLSSLTNQGPHGLTEILYAFTSGAGNNGSAFAGPERQHLVVQRGAGLGHARRAASHDDSGAGPGRQPGAEEERASLARNLPGEHARCLPCCWSA